MTREEHIYQLEQYLRGHSICMCPSSSLYWKEHWEEVIKALEQESTTKNDLGDEYISRSELMAILSDYYDTTVEYRSMLKEIASLPPVTPQEPRTGHWRPIYQGDEIIDYRCSKCEFGNTFGKSTHGMNYCPHCGAKMESEET